MNKAFIKGMMVSAGGVIMALVVVNYLKSNDATSGLVSKVL
jgi:hypothetical protein